MSPRSSANDLSTRDEQGRERAIVPRRLSSFWRWFGIACRAVHLVAVVLLGATVLGAEARAPMLVTGSVLLGSGVMLLALEIWKSGDHLRQLAGAGMLAKLAFVAWMLLAPRHAEAAFWIIVLWSVVFAHAPASFRHRPLAFWHR